MSVVRRHLADGAVSPNKLHAALKGDKYFQYGGDYLPASCATATPGFGAPSGLDTESFYVLFKNGTWTGKYIGAAGTLKAPRWGVAGLDALLTLSLDQSAGDGVNYINEVHALRDPIGYSIPAEDVFFRVRGKVNLVAEVAQLAIGFSDGTDPDYTDANEFYVVDIQAGDVHVAENIDGGGATDADTGLVATDDTFFEIEVRRVKGEIRRYFNGVEVGQRYTPTQGGGLTLFPIIHFVNGASGTDFSVTEIEAGRLADVDDTKADGLY